MKNENDLANSCGEPETGDHPWLTLHSAKIATDERTRATIEAGAENSIKDAEIVENSEDTHTSTNGGTEPWTHAKYGKDATNTARS